MAMYFILNNLRPAFWKPVCEDDALSTKNAAASDYVAKEKGRALLRAYPQLSQRDATLKICPISIEPRAEPAK